MSKSFTFTRSCFQNIGLLFEQPDMSTSDSSNGLSLGGTVHFYGQWKMREVFGKIIIIFAITIVKLKFATPNKSIHFTFRY